jgi:hypothetical protein
VTVISEGTLTVPVTQVFAAPEAAWLRASGETGANDLLASGQAVILVQLGGAAILIDPVFDAPGSAWEARFRRKWPALSRSPGLDAGQAALGIAPEAITHVVITHARDDPQAQCRRATPAGHPPSGGPSRTSTGEWYPLQRYRLAMAIAGTGMDAYKEGHRKASRL